MAQSSYFFKHLMEYLETNTSLMEFFQISLQNYYFILDFQNYAEIF